jgi:hypothetical protein
MTLRTFPSKDSFPAVATADQSVIYACYTTVPDRYDSVTKRYYGSETVIQERYFIAGSIPMYILLPYSVTSPNPRPQGA